MCRVVALVVILRCIAAHADDDTPGITVTVPERWNEHGAFLQLDSALAAGMRPTTKGFAITEHEEARVVDVIGPLRAYARGSWWSNEQSQLHGPGAQLDVMARGWESSVGLTTELGPLTLNVFTTLGRVDSPYTHGTYRDTGVSIGKRFTLSRWMKAWIALSVASRQWYGKEPPPGESNGTTIMLGIGTTFR